MAVNIGPKIGLDGEKEYRSALGNIIQQQKLLNAEMQKVSSAYDTNATSIKKNKEQHELLGKAVENQQKRVDMLRAGLQDYESKAGSSATETLKMKQALAEAETELNNLQRQFKDTGPLNTWCNAVAEAGEKLQGVGQKMQDVGGMATKYLTAPIMAAGTASLKASVDFESGMAQVQATMGLTADAESKLNGQTVNTMDALGSLARKMGSETKFSATEAADAINILAMAGMDTQQIYDALPNVLNLAAAGNISIAEAADIATGSMAGFGLETKQSAEVADKLATLASKAKGDVQSFGAGMSTVAGQAKITGQNLDTVSVALGILGNHNIAASEGGTMLQRVLKNLYQPTSTGAKALESLGVSAYNADGSARPLQAVLQDLNGQLGTLSQEDYNSVMGQIFDTAALKGASFLIDECGTEWDELAGYIAESDGAAQQMSDTLMNTTEGQLTILKSSLSELAISLGQQLIPYVQDGITWVQGIVDKFNSMDDGTKKLIVTVGAFLAAAGPLLIFGGKVVSSIGTIMTAAKAIPGMITTIQTVGGTFVGAAKGALSGLFGLIMAHPVIAVTAAVIGAFVLLYSKCEWFRDAVHAVLDWLHTGVENIGTFTKNTITGVVNFFTTSGNNIKNFTSNTINEVKSLWANGLNAVKTTVGNIFGGIYNTISSKLGSARDFVKGAIDRIKGFFNFSWSLPHLKLPHVSISGSFSLVPPRVPHFSINWYRKAMEGGTILKNATIFGAAGNTLLGGGEAGPEAVVGVSSLARMIKSAVLEGFHSVISGMAIAPTITNTYGDTNVYIYTQPGQDAEEIAELAADKVNERIREEREVFA